MKRMILGMLVGFIVSALCFIPTLLRERREEFENGKHTGEIMGRIELWRALNKHFACESAPSTEVEDYIPVKDVGIWVLKQDGVLTVQTR